MQGEVGAGQCMVRDHGKVWGEGLRGVGEGAKGARGSRVADQANWPGAPPWRGRSAPSRSIMSVCSLRLIRTSF